jgi:hypothetical protein
MSCRFYWPVLRCPSLAGFGCPPRDLRHDHRRALFADLLRIINDNKRFSIAATLTTDLYKQRFSEAFTENEMGVYGMCFLVLAVMLGKHAEATGYQEKIPFLMDTGNPYKGHVVDVHKFLTTSFQDIYPVHAGRLTFSTDTDDCALEAADLIAWTVRRKLVGRFDHGFEPLVDLLAEQHMEQQLEDEVMRREIGHLKVNSQKHEAGQHR